MNTSTRGVVPGWHGPSGLCEPLHYFGIIFKFDFTLYISYFLMFKSAYTMKLDWDSWTLSDATLLLHSLFTNAARQFPLRHQNSVKQM